MICALFSGRYPDVLAACKEVLGITSDEYCQDVLAILIGGTEHPPTEHFVNATVEITKHFYRGKEAEPAKTVDGLVTALHSLVSGTLDVDRLDYLQRDSHFIGVPYGLCDTEVLINGLRLAVIDEDGSMRLVLALKARATKALDDMLWGRFQLFSQVLNHKTNVMLNALLAEAIPEALDDNQVNLKQPKTFDDFLLFTDDHVMSAVMTACIHNDKLARRVYARALVHRKLPIYLQCLEIPEAVEGAADPIAAEQANQAKTVLKPPQHPSDIHTWSVQSALLKHGGGTMPYVVRRSKISQQEEVLPPSEIGLYKLQEWCEKKMLPMEIHTCHFFVDPEKVMAIN